MRIVPIFFLLVSLVFARDPQIITVAILSGANSVNISCRGKIFAVDMSQNRKSVFPPRNSYLVLPSPRGIKIRNYLFSNMVRLFAKKDFIRVNGKSYRDSIIISQKKGLLTVINEIGVEGYLFGVLPREVSPKWSFEALKAQAVVSRTYILKNLGRFKSKGYDLCSSEISQVYGGADCERENTTKAVIGTQGEVLYYRGKLASVYFHADAAGHTENPKFVWGTPNPPAYLKGVKEKYRKKSPYSDWRTRISYREIALALREKGYHLKRVRRVAKKGRTPSGRVKEIIVYSDSGKIRIPSNKFRTIFGTRNIKSTKIRKITNTRAGAIFYGQGWGHGVGFSQWGAKDLAERGWNYRKILRFYFPGAKIKKSKG
ncbi:MAG: SpoIID/LytB domain-containing protein [Elusimicrobia bacterium]|nr:SpoIID/LytB domain-containing protein [Elusimicrobiota bacterium]